jgi:hypothetical protein
MNRLLLWFVFGVFFTAAILMITFGVLFIKDVYVNRAEVAFGSLIFGIILLLAGGGLLSSTVAETIRKLIHKS